MTDISRRDVLIGTGAVVAAAALPAIPAEPLKGLVLRTELVGMPHQMLHVTRWVACLNLDREVISWSQIDDPESWDIEAWGGV